MNKLKKEKATRALKLRGTSHVTRPGTNIFLDLGFPPELAAEYWAESKMRIAAKLAKQEVK